MIYVIKTEKGNYRKIGFAENPKSRIIDMQTGCPLQLSLEITGEGGPEKESYIHRTFESYWIRGEWFSIPKREVAKLTNLVTMSNVDFAAMVKNEKSEIVREDSAKKLEEILAKKPITEMEKLFWSDADESGIAALCCQRSQWGTIVKLSRSVSRHLVDEDANGSWANVASAYSE